VSDTRQAPSGDASFRSSLARALAGAAGVVVLGAASFWVVGTIGGDETPVVADEPEPGPAEPADDVEAEEPAEGDDAEPDAPDEDDAGEDAEDGEDDAAQDDVEPDEADADTEDAEEVQDEDAEEGGEDADDEADDEVARDVDPSSVTIQVLDGFKTDGGTAADDLTGQLEGAGYSVVARNDALNYASTTVLFNPGFEAAAQQVAAELGGAVVSEQPGNLSTSVELHVVVGADRG
jgi:hypothetical protein